VEGKPAHDCNISINQILFTCWAWPIAIKKISIDPPDRDSDFSIAITIAIKNLCRINQTLI
jgi:hypothetical protein